MTQKARIIFRILFLLYLAAILCLCFMTVSNVQSIPWTIWGIPTDKFVHFWMFVPFPFLSYWSFYNKRGQLGRLIGFLLLTIVAGMVLGGAIEIVQGMLVYRSRDLMDFRADTIGIAVSVFVLLSYSVLSKNY